MENKKSYDTQKLVLTGLFIAVSVIMSLFDIPVPIGGAIGLRISLSGIISKIPAVLYGPIWGMLTSGVTDVLCHFAKPEGAFNIFFTLTSAFGGFMVGGLSRTFKVNTSDFSEKFFKLFVLVTTIIGALGFVNMGILSFIPQCAYSEFLISMGVTKSGVKIVDYINFTFVSVFVITSVICLLNICYKKLSHDTNERFIKLLITLLISNVIVTTINSFIIMKMYITSDIALLVFYIPRLAEEVIVTCIQTAGMTYLLKLMEKIRK